jgi:dihydrofolate reductase
VAKLKQQLGKDLLIMGSGELIRSLMRRDLIDEYVLLIHPLILGAGRLFAEGSSTTTLRLAETKATASGVLFATFQAVDAPAPATA